MLGADDPAPVEVFRAEGESRVFLTCEHAGREIPASLGTLGVPASELDRHIAWDIGAHGVAVSLAELLDATLVAQRYSRLVVDCNRPADAHDFVPARSEHTDVPGNQALDAMQVARRTDEIYHPCHQTIGRLLDQRDRARRETVLVSVHSCTPSFINQHRPWHVGVLHERKLRIGPALMRALGAGNPDLSIGDNQPYRLDLTRDYAIPGHGHARGYLHLGLEIRQDLIADSPGQREWAERLHDALHQALDEIAE